MRIGFIGCGNMATAIIDGILKKNFIDCKDIFAFDVYDGAIDSACTEYGINKCKSESDVVDNSDAIILAVKPNVIADVLKKADGAITRNNPLIISIAAGKSIEYIESSITTKQRVIRIMPNINAKVGEAMSAYCSNDLARDEDKKFVSKMLQKTGKCIELDEAQFPLFGVLGGCTPAFAYMFIDALARAGVKNGMKKETALEIAAQTVYGSAKMIMESDENPWKLVDNVCSPGGTTIEGVTSLQADGLEAAIHNAVQKALDKDKKL